MPLLVFRYIEIGYQWMFRHCDCWYKHTGTSSEIHVMTTEKKFGFLLLLLFLYQLICALSFLTPMHDNFAWQKQPFQNHMSESTNSFRCYFQTNGLQFVLDWHIFIHRILDEEKLHVLFESLRISSVPKSNPMKQKPKNQVENEMETTEMRMKFHRDHLEGKAKQNIGVHENARDEHVLLESTGIVFCVLRNWALNEHTFCHVNIHSLTRTLTRWSVGQTGLIGCFNYVNVVCTKQ